MAKLMAVTPIFAFLLVALSACTAENTVDTDSASQTPEQTQTLRIAAAANLSDVLPQIIDGYKTDENLAAQDIDVTYASSGKLYAQIKAGAPYDIFLSANQEFPAKLAAERVVDNAKNNESYTPFTYTQGQLALYSVTKSLHGLEPAAVIYLLIKDANSKIAIANPELAPYGVSAQAYLQSQNLYNTLNKQKRLIQAENIGQAFQYAHTGSVDYGFVAQSQIIAIKAKPEQFIMLAPASYPAIFQDGIVISDAPIAADFTDYLRSKAGQHYFSQAGYLMVK
ncbi:molybdate ABC transporter substrate-binding protein [Psychrobacter glaciei]|uniref:molybdate ABC transporter substrate-binding protein n=1 Tax=Psychrobacter glaciei TaxID=619771 RepID=UPI001F057AEC|nr:molybdate ABC transporter substrate-binding protein [Psychrobacter glaciei]MCH1783743.1 molybdate ABC transporter substrate-binding protein [Psychrobacter glaciei]